MAGSGYGLDENVDGSSDEEDKKEKEKEELQNIEE